LTSLLIATWIDSKQVSARPDLFEAMDYNAVATLIWSLFADRPAIREREVIDARIEEPESAKTGKWCP
jgi:hypothetical protein